MTVIVGSYDKHFDSNAVGYVPENKINKFANINITVEDWKAHKSDIFECFLQDLGLFVDGKTGKILANQFKVDLPTRNVDQGGGSKHMAASAAGMNGCLAVKCSEDCCLVDGNGKGDLKVFSGTKIPTDVPVISTTEYELVDEFDNLSPLSDSIKKDSMIEGSMIEGSMIDDSSIADSSIPDLIIEDSSIEDSITKVSSD